jgi:predicted nucleic acid-binding protein
MGEVVFIDTSVLVNLLDVPNMNSHREHVAEVFRAGQGKGMTYVIPVTTIIEAGNHIAQIQGHGDLRHECARRLVDALKMALVDQPPWVLTGSVWDHGSVHRAG